MKVEVNFDSEFDDTILPIPLGRIHVGNHIGRLCFLPSGKTALIVSAEAIKDGSIVLWQPPGGPLGLSNIDTTTENLLSGPRSTLDTA